MVGITTQMHGSNYVRYAVQLHAVRSWPITVEPKLKEVGRLATCFPSSAHLTTCDACDGCIDSHNLNKYGQRHNSNYTAQGLETDRSVKLVSSEVRRRQEYRVKIDS
jgi:hypothetical protein